MKRLIGIILFVATQVQAQSVATAKLEVQGMTCVTCPVTVRKVLEKEPGVSSVAVDFASRTATVVFDPARTTPEKLAKAVSEAGFPSSAGKGG